MNDKLDVQAIARRVRLSPRKVRYVLDQRLLPGMRGRLQKHLAGQPRSFTSMEAFFVGCAALLLEGGVQRRTVVELMARLADMPWPPPGAAEGPGRRSAPKFGVAVEAIYFAAGPAARVLVGDGVNLRLRLGGVDTGWVEPRSLARLEQSYRPTVLIELDLACVHAAFRPGSPG
jgi:hypothetical protein